MSYYSNINFNSDITLMVELGKIKNESLKNINPVFTENISLSAFDEISDYNKKLSEIKGVHLFNLKLRLPIYAANKLSFRISSINNDLNLIPSKDLPKNIILHQLGFNSLLKSSFTKQMESSQKKVYRSFDKIVEHISNVIIFTCDESDYVHVIDPLDAKPTFDKNDISSQYKDEVIYTDMYISNIKYYKYNKEDYDTVVMNYLIKYLDTLIDKSKTINALCELWLYQIQNKNIKLKDDFNFREIISNDFYSILENIDHDTNVPNKSTETLITYRQLFEFFDEIEAGVVTEKTHSAQEWLTISNFPVLMKSLIANTNFSKINQSIKKLSPDQSQDIIKTLQKDITFRNKCSILNIYEVNSEKPLEAGHSRFTGIHGSINNSVPSILLNGLKTNKTLNKFKLKHKYTGSGLGQGVYFARLNQCSKSSNYTQSQNGNIRYMFIADVDYDDKKVLTVKNYNSSLNTEKYSLVIGDKVGSKGLDEIVAPHDEQINIRYLVEFK